jgi:RIO kinase 1
MHVKNKNSLIQWTLFNFDYSSGVILQSFIPKTLEHVKNAEEDVQRITSGQDTGDMYYQTITGLKNALSRGQRSPAEQAADPSEGSSINPAGHSNPSENIRVSQAVEDEESSSDSEASFSSRSEAETPEDKKAARKENKKKVKEEKREARKNKVPKALKKRKKKLAKAQKTR